jgi:uncharacterized protein (DUF1697 family)
MPRYVALLRSVNVAGHGRLAMADLVRSFETLSHRDVSTYIQTGNVLFTSSSKSPARLASGLEAQLAKDFGAAPAVIVRTVDDLLRVGESSPYAKAKADPARHHVTFLAQAPSAARLASFKVPASRRDELVIDGLEVYVHTPDGYATTKLTGSYLERHLGVLSTTRNWNTVTKLCALARRAG